MAKHRNGASRILVNFLFFSVFALVTTESAAENKAPEVKCPEKADIAPKLPRSATYKGLPYGAGEQSRYELNYGALNVHVGYGFIRVLPPVKRNVAVGGDRLKNQVVYEKRWHRVFSAEGFTGDWYKMIFRAKDNIHALVRPWDGGASHFYISQDESKPFGRDYRREKWLDYNHVTCKTKTKDVEHHQGKSKIKSYDLEPGAMDAISAVFKLRSHDHVLGKTAKFLVYTSEKNWWLQATPVREEVTQVKYGKFNAIVLRVQSYLGEDLQQSGELLVWIAKDHPNRLLLKVEGQVRFGSFYIELDQYQPGNA